MLDPKTPAPPAMIPAAVAELQREATERAFRWTVGEGMAQARIAGEQVGAARSRFDRLRDEWGTESKRLDGRRLEALERVDELTNRNDELETTIDTLQPEILKLRRLVVELTKSRGQAIELARDCLEGGTGKFREGSELWTAAEVLRGRLSGVEGEPIEGLRDVLDALEDADDDDPPGWAPGTLSEIEGDGTGEALPPIEHAESLTPHASAGPPFELSAELARELRERSGGDPTVADRLIREAIERAGLERIPGD